MRLRVFRAASAWPMRKEGRYRRLRCWSRVCPDMTRRSPYSSLNPLEYYFQFSQISPRDCQWCIEGNFEDARIRPGSHNLTRLDGLSAAGQKLRKPVQGP